MSCSRSLSSSSPTTDSESLKVTSSLPQCVATVFLNGTLQKMELHQFLPCLLYCLRDSYGIVRAVLAFELSALLKKHPELLVAICNHMGEPEKESGIYQNQKKN